MAHFKVGDWIATVRQKPDFLGRRIQEFQRYKGFSERAILYTHSEVVWWVSPDGLRICTFSQTFPRAIPVYYDAEGFMIRFRGQKADRDLYRIKDYQKYVTPRFVSNLDRKAREICKQRPTRWAKFLGMLGINYDVFQLPGYWLNEIFPGRRHINWLEMPGGVGVCSDKAAEVLDAGFWAELGYSPIFLNEPNSEVSPAHISTEPYFERVMV